MTWRKLFFGSTRNFFFGTPLRMGNQYCFCPLLKVGFIGDDSVSEVAVEKLVVKLLALLLETFEGFLVQGIEVILGLLQCLIQALDLPSLFFEESQAL